MKPISRRFLALALVGFLALNTLLPAAATAQQIWFSPGDDLNVNDVVAHPDFMHLFDGVLYMAHWCRPCKRDEAPCAMVPAYAG